MSSAESAAGRPRSNIFAVVFGLFVATIVLEAASIELRYLKYGLPFAALMIIGASPLRPRRLVGSCANYFGGMLTLLVVSILGSLVGAMIAQAVTVRFFSETYFIITPLLIAYWITPYVERDDIPKYVVQSFWVVVAAYAIETRLGVLSSFADPSTLEYKFLTSDLGSESNASFLFGLYALYFAFEKKRRFTIAAFILTVLSFKRIAIFGVVLGLVGYGAFQWTHLDAGHHRRKLAVLLVLVNVVILLATYKITYGYFDDFFLETTGMSTDWATQGRTGVWRLVFSNIPFSTLGHGLGSVTVLLQANGATILNAHSDVMKYAVEVGPIISVIWIFYFYWQHTKSNKLFMLAGYLNVLLITDNVSIYVPVMLLFYLLSAFLMMDRDDRSTRHVSEGDCPTAVLSEARG